MFSDIKKIYIKRTIELSCGNLIKIDKQWFIEQIENTGIDLNSCDKCRSKFERLSFFFFIIINTKNKFKCKAP